LTNIKIWAYPRASNVFSKIEVFEAGTGPGYLLQSFCLQSIPLIQKFIQGKKDFHYYPLRKKNPSKASNFGRVFLVIFICFYFKFANAMAILSIAFSRFAVLVANDKRRQFSSPKAAPFTVVIFAL